MSLVQSARVALRIGPVMDVGRPKEAGGRGGSRGELIGLPVELRDVAADAIVPVAGLGRCEANHQLPAAVPERRHRHSAVSRGAELGLQLDRFVRIGMRRSSLRREFENDVARLVGRDAGTRSLRA
jgi:hypothetical protein